GSRRDGRQGRSAAQAGAQGAEAGARQGAGSGQDPGTVLIDPVTGHAGASSRRGWSVTEQQEGRLAQSASLRVSLILFTGLSTVCVDKRRAFAGLHSGVG